MADWNTLTSNAFDAILSAFSEPIEYKKKGANDGLMISGVFRNDYLAVEGNSFDAVVSSATPLVEIKKSAIPWKASPGDVLIVRGTTYKVADIKPCGVAEEVALVLRKL